MSEVDETATAAEPKEEEVAEETVEAGEGTVKEECTATFEPVVGVFVCVFVTTLRSVVCPNRLPDAHVCMIDNILLLNPGRA
jgi:hypothetical protein